MFKCIFNHPAEGREGGEHLLQLQQGNQMAGEHALTLRTVAASSGWNEPVLSTLFRRGLRKEVQVQLACRDDNLTLTVWLTSSGSVGIYIASLPPLASVWAQSLNSWR